MKTREYEDAGFRYRWKYVPNYIIHEVCVEPTSAYSIGQWTTYDAVSNTPAAASALAALIEDMQVQVIAEWEDGDGFLWRARQSGESFVAEYHDRETDGWYQDNDASNGFRAGYEAGKA